MLLFFSNGHIRNVVSTLPNVVKIDVENDNVVCTLSNVVLFNFEKQNVVSTLFYVVNFNFDIHNVVSTLIWRCATSWRHINLKTTLNHVEMFAVWCFKLIFIIQYAVPKNIFACLFSVHNTRSLSSHEQVSFIRLHFEILPPSFTEKACKFIIKRDPKNFLEVAKRIEHLQQNALVKLSFPDSDSGQV